MLPIYYSTKKGTIKTIDNMWNYPKVPHTYKKKVTSQTSETINLKSIKPGDCQNKKFMCAYMKYLESLLHYSKNKNQSVAAQSKLRAKHEKMFQKLQNTCFC